MYFYDTWVYPMKTGQSVWVYNVWISYSAFHMDYEAQRYEA
jgi:hypothetical protein